MPRADATRMPFAKLYPLLVRKAEKKGRSREEVDRVTAWLTGCTRAEITRLEQSDTSYGDFFRNAPAMNPDRARITGKVCGVRVEEIEDPLMRDIRYLDKLVDELAGAGPWSRFCGSNGGKPKKDEIPPALCLQHRMGGFAYGGGCPGRLTAA